MARRRERKTPEIEIERNAIEQFLMDSKRFARENSRKVLYSLVGLFSATVLVIAGFVYVENVTTSEKVRFDKIINAYEKSSRDGDKKKIDESVDELEKFVDSTSFGFAHEMGYYILGNVYFSEKKYKKASKYLQIFADKSSSDLFTSLALLKAAVALEESNDFDGALKLYKELEESFSESLIADQVYYNYARLYGIKKDIYNSKKYYNKVINAYPQSSFAAKARKRLFLLGNIKAEPGK